MTSPEPRDSGLSPATGRSVAITFDDLPVMSVSRGDVAAHRETTIRLLDGLAAHHIPTVGFVNEHRLSNRGVVDAERIGLLERWLDAGHELANHTCSHLDLHRVTAREFEHDVLQGEPVTRGLLEARGLSLRYFRHPYLHIGRDLETRREIEGFLTRHGYLVAPVTLYTEDFLFAAAYDWSLHLGNERLAARVARAYLDYLAKVFDYYETLSVRVFGHEIPQILLFHANALNASQIDAIAGLIASRGYAFASLDQVLSHPAYGSADEYFGNHGISWLKRWAITRGKGGRFLEAEPMAPRFVRWRARTPLRIELRRWAGRTRETLYERIKRPLKPWVRRLSRSGPGRARAPRRGSSTR